MLSVADRKPVLLQRRGAAGRASVLSEETVASELLSAYTVASVWLRVLCPTGRLACKKNMVALLASDAYRYCILIPVGFTIRPASIFLKRIFVPVIAQKLVCY
jgi:hypothetical protein